MNTLRRRPAGRRSGFTLIEMLAVLVIIAILAAFLFPALMGMTESFEGGMTDQYMGQLALAISAYESDEGDYPLSSFSPDKVADGGGTNAGGEALVAALFSDGREGYGLDEEHFCNTDSDSSRKALTDLGHRRLQEFKDAWDNPIAYFHHSEYGDFQTYLTFDPETGEEIEGQVKAMKKDGGAFYQRRRYQLISAGPDGRFGTDDDVTSFARGD